MFIVRATFRFLTKVDPSLKVRELSYCLHSLLNSLFRALILQLMVLLNFNQRFYTLIMEEAAADILPTTAKDKINQDLISYGAGDTLQSEG